MKLLVIVSIVVANFIIQSTIFPHIEVAGVMPNSLIAIIVSLSLLNGSFVGALAGFFGGLLQDIFFSGAIGINALIYLLIGWSVGLAHEKVYSERFFMPTLFIFSSTVVYELYMLIVVFFYRYDINIYHIFMKIILPGAIYTSIIGVIIYNYIFKLYKYKFMRKKWLFIKP
ncbi:MAG: rod shape-determining protein MreD [Mahellales bacterium]|jgi:rod shape-determining protein MreD